MYNSGKLCVLHEETKARTIDAEEGTRVRESTGHTNADGPIQT